ncbi:DUF4413 domain-containing protein [Cephalotus follicularis]|uniref:DUF4413 domain-containing protein n=1 Tax=Cephalotus follicularis TaxID=3775 RepID=A0A1Q3CAF4_CEPFO|nr:DUF4413 domain-containing protein [Cephalotus follicularis]
MEKFDKYWHVIHDVMGVANILDPRFKIKYCKFFYNKIYENDYCQEEIDRIKNICYDLVCEYQSKQASNLEHLLIHLLWKLCLSILILLRSLCKSKTKKILVREN